MPVGLDLSKIKIEKMDKHNSPSKLISRVFICCLLLIGITSNSQNWVSTEFTPFDSFAINDVVSHDGNLYATYATGFGNVLGKSENDGVTWQELNPTGITGYPTLLLSVGNRLYLSTINIIDSHLYYSTDGGATFTEDINGLPAGFFGGASLINRIQFMNNRLVIGMGGAGYYQKSMSSPSGAFAFFDTPTGLNSGSDRLVFYNGSLFTYDNSGAFTFYQSADFGANWTIPASSGLPANLNSEILSLNPTTGRIYLSGTFDSGSQYGLYFSDDLGASWSEFDLSMVSSTNYLGDFHKVTAMYTNGPLFYAALDNDLANTEPDVISSNNLGATAPTLDTMGLPNDTTGGIFGNKIIVHNNKPVMALNVVDVYIKDETLNTNDFSSAFDLKVYPTVVRDYITIKNITAFKGIIYDNTGKQVMTFESQTSIQRLDINQLEDGIYYLHVTNVEGLNVVKKILKTN